MLKLHLAVTEEDIKSGKKSSSEFCPIALALERHLTQLGKTHNYCDVYEDYVGIIIDEKSFLGYLPYAASYFIEEYDSDIEVSPIEFDIIFTEQDEE